MSTKGAWWGIPRSIWISTVDLMAYLSFLGLLATGLLLKFQLPHGRGTGATGRGNYGFPPERRGWTRLEWGELHFWVSVLFLCAIGFHLFLHSTWIQARFKGRRRWLALGLIGLTLGAVLLGLGFPM